jgi:hypothetical protein
MRSLLNTLLVVAVISMLSLTTVLAMDKAKAKKEHRHHHAHTHGSGKMSMAFDGLNGRIEFEVAAESILGFEYTPKTDKDKKTVANAIKIFQQDFNKMVQFDSALGCVITADKVEQKMEGKTSSHSDFKASYYVACKKSVVNSTVKFNFSQYEHLNDVDVTILADKVQKNFEISNKESSVDLK